ncbi:unnamed protein product [Symbiodinium sp. CCMP2592]|nr:unnamed protein product [Symbiodinium sp. CCMP2592]
MASSLGRCWSVAVLLYLYKAPRCMFENAVRPLDLAGVRATDVATMQLSAEHLDKLQAAHDRVDKTLQSHTALHQRVEVSATATMAMVPIENLEKYARSLELPELSERHQQEVRDHLCQVLLEDHSEAYHLLKVADPTTGAQRLQKFLLKHRRMGREVQIVFASFEDQRNLRTSSLDLGEEELANWMDYKLYSALMWKLEPSRAREEQLRKHALQASQAASSQTDLAACIAWAMFFISCAILAALSMYSATLVSEGERQALCSEHQHLHDEPQCMSGPDALPEEVASPRAPATPFLSHPLEDWQVWVCCGR